MVEPTPAFSNPSSHGPSTLAKALWVVAGIFTVLVSATAMFAVTVIVKDAAKDMRVAVLEASLDLRAAARDIDAMVPPNNDKLFTILSKGIGVTESAVLTTTVGTTPAAAFTTDLVTTPLNQQTDAFTQEIFIQNTHASQNLCYRPIAWATAGATCTLKCAGIVATLTCTAAVTDGMRLAPGQGVQRRYDGTSCVCVVGSAAGTNFQSERVIR